MVVKVYRYKKVKICKDNTCIEFTPIELKELKRLLTANEKKKGFIDRIIEAFIPSEKEEEEVEEEEVEEIEGVEEEEVEEE